MSAINWIDLPQQTKERTVLTFAQMQVPGLRMLGQHCASQALSPLHLHFHENCFELTYIAKGNTCFSVDNQKYYLSGGDLFATKPNEIHDTGSLPIPLHKMFWFQLDCSNPDAFLFLQREEAAALFSAFWALELRVIKLDTAHSTDLMDTVFRLMCDTSARSKRQAAALLVYFLYSILDSAQQTQFNLTPDIGRAAGYILDHITDELELEQLAQISLLSLSRFKQKFKTQMGATPRGFINYHKVEYSKSMLLEGQSVTDIAMELGFSSSNYFSVVFKRYTCRSPAQYVKERQDPEARDGYTHTAESAAP